MPNVENQIWCDSQSHGTVVASGGHADHWKLSDRTRCGKLGLVEPLPCGTVSDNPHGYAIVDHKSKVVTLAPSTASRTDLDYVPTTVEAWYQRKYQHYQIHVKGDYYGIKRKFNPVTGEDELVYDT